MIGAFNEKGLPTIKIKVRGTSGNIQELDAIVDTGDNGYLMLPYSTAFSLGLVLEGVEQSNSGADGKVFPSLVARGDVSFGDKEYVSTLINVLPNGKILIGNSLLKIMGKTICIDFLNSKVEVTNTLKADH